MTKQKYVDLVVQWGGGVELQYRPVIGDRPWKNVDENIWRFQYADGSVRSASEPMELRVKPEMWYLILNKNGTLVGAHDNETRAKLRCAAMNDHEQWQSGPFTVVPVQRVPDDAE